MTKIIEIKIMAKVDDIELNDDDGYAVSHDLYFKDNYKTKDKILETKMIIETIFNRYEK